MENSFEHIISEFHSPLTNPVLIFSLILFIILFAPILLKKFNLPGIIGLIISGVIIGPKGLGILANDSAIHLFSTIGILYIMFIAGLELDLQQFKANKNKSLLFGAFTFFFPLAIGFPACFYLLGYDFNASFLTASMFATHTLVAYSIVSKLGVSKNQAVAITVGGTILTDTAVLIILAVIVGNSHGGLTKQFWITLGISLLVFSAIMFLIVPRIAKWFFQKMESEKHAHYIFVLAVVFFAAFLAEAIGLEPIIGAFVAGLALNKLIPHSSALMNRIEFIGNSLFIPFFLISVGMLVDVRVIFSGPMALLVAATLSITAIAGKWIAALFTQLIFKYSNEQRQLIFGLSSSHAAATLAVILVGFKAKILDENILNGTIILILITCIVASFVTEKAAKKIVINDEESREALPEYIDPVKEHILLAAASIANIEKLLEFALLIKNKKSDTPISILSVVPNNIEAEKNIIKSRDKLEAFVKQASATEIKANVITAIDHNAASGIARASRETTADIIITSWPKRSRITDLLMGEEVENIARRVDKNLFIGYFKNTLISHRRVVLVSPPLAELEKGFNVWVQKIVRLAQELSLPIAHFGHHKTQETIKKLIKKRSFNIHYTSRHFDDWENFTAFSDRIREEDLIIVIAARTGSVSYISVLDHLPLKLEKYLNKNSKIIVYPQQNIQVSLSDDYGEFSARPLKKGIEAIEILSKGLGGIFKKNK